MSGALLLGSRGIVTDGIEDFACGMPIGLSLSSSPKGASGLFVGTSGCGTVFKYRGTLGCCGDFGGRGERLFDALGCSTGWCSFTAGTTCGFGSGAGMCFFAADLRAVRSAIHLTRSHNGTRELVMTLSPQAT